MMVVTQSIISCQFNSHLLDFTQSWLYVFGVGIFGGTVLGSKAGGALGDARAPATSPGRRYDLVKSGRRYCNQCAVGRISDLRSSR
jgi:hypothetical protein